MTPSKSEVKNFARGLEFYNGNKGLALVLFEKGLITKEEILEAEEYVRSEIQLQREEELRDRY